MFTTLDGNTILAGAQALIGESGQLSLDLDYQYVYNYALNITFICRPKVQLCWTGGCRYGTRCARRRTTSTTQSVQNLKDQQAKLVAQIASFDAVTLRLMEQEEIMKGVLRWLLGPQFYLVPFDLASLFGSDSNDPGVTGCAGSEPASDTEWLNVMEHGEFIKYIHNAIEWENVLYFTYPYFWDDNKLWDFKKFLYHPDPTHRTFLRSGAARVVLTIRPGFEPSFTSLLESGAFNTLPQPASLCNDRARDPGLREHELSGISAGEPGAGCAAAAVSGTTAGVDGDAVHHPAAERVQGGDWHLFRRATRRPGAGSGADAVSERPDRHQRDELQRHQRLQHAVEQAAARAGSDDTAGRACCRLMPRCR